MDADQSIDCRLDFVRRNRWYQLGNVLKSSPIVKKSKESKQIVATSKSRVCKIIESDYFAAFTCKDQGTGRADSHLAPLYVSRMIDRPRDLSAPRGPGRCRDQA